MTSRKAPNRIDRLAAETGAIVKNRQNKIHVALVYPNHYSVGMSNLGFQTIYRLLNSFEQVVCERVFFPDQSSGKADVASIESGRTLQAFHCVAFSISFENDYANMLEILQKAELPLLSALRGASLPLIIAGGASCFINPEPIAPFIDCFILGEAEGVLEAFFQPFDPNRNRRAFLLEAAQTVPGVYVPEFYRPEYTDSGCLQRFSPIEDVPPKIKRVFERDIGSFATDSVILTNETSFENTQLIEVSRGCPHGCRFCSAGYIYRPPRFRPFDRLQDSLVAGARRTHKIGLLGAAVSDLPDLKALCDMGRTLGCRLSFSSLRADALDDNMLAALKAAGSKTATIAPECGSERLRRVVNKGLKEDTILEAAEKLVAAGIPNLKLYFMIGLPTETMEDIDAIVTLVKKIKHRYLQSSRSKGHIGQVTVSVSSFVPKPHTPFQWVAMDEVKHLKHKITVIKTGLKKVANVRVHADVPRWAYIQAFLSCGDRRVSELLQLSVKNHQNWPQTLKNSPINADFFVYRERNQDELLPWDFIDMGIDKPFLWREYQRALQALDGPTCPMDPDQCRMCGVCKPEPPGS